MRYAKMSAIVTGAASGLGRATATRLAAAGMHVVLVDLPTSDGAAVAEELRTNRPGASAAGGSDVAASGSGAGSAPPAAAAQAVARTSRRRTDRRTDKHLPRIEFAPADVTEVLTCLSCDSKQEVLDLKASALANGGSPWRDDMDYGAMYGASFKDPDGHVWELMWMDPSAQGGG